MQLFGKTEKAVFLSRPNRFVVLCKLRGRTVDAYLPNPGRLWELLLPGVVLYLEKSTKAGRKMTYTVVAVERKGLLVSLHTLRTNDVAEYLIEKGLIPGLKGAEIIKREVTVKGSRFDFLLKKGRFKIFLEVKSCTLFSDRVAMFPDAVTERGRRHIEELISLTKGNTKGYVLFVVNNPHVECFMPDFHTDLEFSQTLLSARDKITINPISIRLNKNLSLTREVRPIKIPWEIIKKETRDRGSYLIVLRLPESTSLEVGGLGRLNFKKGYYIYAGSAKKGLSKRIERHRRLRKTPFWHIDYLRDVSVFLYSLPIRTADNIECALAEELKNVSDSEVPGFGSSDCRCTSHLFRMNKDPLTSRKFHDLLQYFRMERVLGGNFL